MSETCEPLGPCTQAELDAFQALDSKSKRLFLMWVDRALKAEDALREIGLACDGPMSYSRSYLANKIAEIARAAVAPAERTP